MKFIKTKYKNIFSLFYHFFIIIGSLFLLYALNSINFKYNFNPKENLSKIRRLFSGFEKQKTEDICQKADKNLLLLYNSDSFSYYVDNSTLKQSTSYLVNYVENKEDSELKNYIFSFYAQIIILIFEIVLIIIWIILCYFISKDSYMYCLIKMKWNNNCFKNIFFIISIGMYLIIILLNIIILFHLPVILQDINNSFCSLFKIGYHTYNGEENFYEMRPKWTGINQIKNLIQKTKQNLMNLINQNNQIIDKINEIQENKYFNPDDNNNFIDSQINEFCDLNSFPVPSPNPLNENFISEFFYCSYLLNLIEKEYNETFYNNILEVKEIYGILNSISNNIDNIESSLDLAKNKLDSFVKIIKDIEIEYYNNLVFVIETVIRKYLIYIIYIFFFLTFLLKLFGFINMIILRSCFSLYCKKVYNFIWNFQFFFLLIILFIIVCSSSLNIFINDITLILKSSYNSDLKKENTTFSNNKYDVEGINICIIEDANLARYMNLDTDAESISHFYSKINIIIDKLNYFKNLKLISEENETQNLINELEQNAYLAEFKNQGIDNYTNAEEILENFLNMYTDNETNQELGNNTYFANYYFVFDYNFCKTNYNILSNINQASECYNDDKNCMLLKDFPENTNYFKTLRTKNIDNTSLINYNLNDYVNMFKKKYYNESGFELSFLSLLNNSKNYLENKAYKESNKLKNEIINIYNIFKNKIDIIHDLYKNILQNNSTDLFSAFNCYYLKRDYFIFLDQLDNNLNRSLSKLTLYCSFLAIFSFLSIIFSLFAIKIKLIERKYNDDLFEPKEKMSKEEVSEKPKVRDIHDNLNFDEGAKSSINENSGFKNIGKNNHVIDIEIEKEQ